MLSPKRYLYVALASAIVAAAVACGSNSNNSGTSTGSTTPSSPTSGVAPACAGAHATGTMSATMNGSAWTAACIETSNYTSGVVAIGASDIATTSVNARILAFSSAASGPATYTIGPNQFNGANAILTVNAQAWIASLIQGSGTITFTTLSATAASGTFSFTMTPAGSASGTYSVTNGAFNITF